MHRVRAVTWPALQSRWSCLQGRTFERMCWVRLAGSVRAVCVFFVLAITDARSLGGPSWNPKGGTMSLRGKIRFNYRPRLKRRPRKRKVARVSGVRIDEPVVCLSCGMQMRLSASSTFKCQRCAQELTGDEALLLLEAAGAIGRV